MRSLVKGYRTILQHKIVSAWTVCRAETTIRFRNGVVWISELSILSEPWKAKWTSMSSVFFVLSIDLSFSSVGHLLPQGWNIDSFFNQFDFYVYSLRASKATISK